MAHHEKDKKGGAERLAPAAAHALANLVEIAPGAIVSRTLAHGPSGGLTVFAFDRGQELSEHTAPFAAFVQVLEGQVELVIGGQRVAARAGDLTLMPAHVPHALRAVEPFKMLLIMLRA